MADFAFHAKHLPPRPFPDDGTIEGRLNPLLDGSGPFRIQVFEYSSGRRIAETTVTSADGEGVDVLMTHAERPEPGQPQPFQRNVRVQIDDEAPRSPVSIWLRQPQDS
jgi:hypothetical protein